MKVYKFGAFDRVTDGGAIPVPEIDAAQAEQQMLAQVEGRRALTTEISARWFSPSPTLLPRVLETPLAAALGLSVAGDRPLGPPHARREHAEAWGDVERFWWRRMLPEMALLTRRRPRITRRSSTQGSSAFNGGTPAVSAAPLNMVDPSGSQAWGAEERGTPQTVTAAPPEGDASAPATVLPADVSVEPAVSEIQATLAGTEALDPSSDPAEPTTVSQPSAAGTSNPGVGALLLAALSRLRPGRNIQDFSGAGAESSTVPPGQEPPSRASTPALAETPQADGAMPADGEATAATEPRDLVDHPSRYEPATTPLGSVAPLALHVLTHAAGSALHTQSSTDAGGGVSPARLFWWPTRSHVPPLSADLSSATRGVRRFDTAFASARDPSLNAPSAATGSAAPGLLGALSQMHASAVESIQRPLDLVHAVRGGERWSQTAVSNLDRWRIISPPSNVRDADDRSDLSSATDNTIDAGPSATALYTDAPTLLGARRAAAVRGHGPLSQGETPSAADDVSSAGPGPITGTSAGSPTSPLPPSVAPQSATAQANAPRWTPIRFVGGLFRGLTQARPTVSAMPGDPTSSAEQQDPAITYADVDVDYPRTTVRETSEPQNDAHPAAASHSRALDAYAPVPESEAPGSAAPTHGQLVESLVRRGTRIADAHTPILLGETPDQPPRRTMPPSSGTPGDSGGLLQQPPGTSSGFLAVGSTNADFSTTALDLPERPADHSDAELAEVIRRLPPAMAAAAIAAGVLGDAAPSLPLKTSVHEAWSPAMEESVWPPPTRPTFVPPPPMDGSHHTHNGPGWGALETAHSTGVSWSGISAGASAAPAQIATVSGPSTASVTTGAGAGALASASVGAGIARAPIDRAVETPVASPNASSGPTSGPPVAGPSGGAAPDLDRLSEEVFDRLRWRLAVERERFAE